jgi:hypothetical protein
MTNDTKSSLNLIMALNTTVIPLSFKTGLSRHPQTGSALNDPHSNFFRQVKHQGNLQ